MLQFCTKLSKSTSNLKSVLENSIEKGKPQDLFVSILPCTPSSVLPCPSIVLIKYPLNDSILHKTKQINIQSKIFSWKFYSKEEATRLIRLNLTRVGIIPLPPSFLVLQLINKYMYAHEVHTGDLAVSIPNPQRVSPLPQSTLSFKYPIDKMHV